MNEPQEWHDLCRKSYPSLAEAQAAVLVVAPLMFQSSEAVFNRKLLAGFEVVIPLRVVYITTRSDGGGYIEMRTVATLRKIVK